MSNTTKEKRATPTSALETKREELGKENPAALKFLHWPLPHGKELHESSQADRVKAANAYRERIRLLEDFADILAQAGTDCEAAVAMAGITETWPEGIAGRRLEGAPAPLFDLELPSGVRLGHASAEELEAAIVDYAERSDDKARLMREVVRLVRRFERVGT